ncbi:MAG TPA: methyltransferase domain-containing protein, partial [Chitinophagaceae bacterium]|nr:methyltransferase domain-containing protein [Chitinophagaceae bacterium]
MGKLKYLNLACGTKIHNDWVNVDFSSSDPTVIKCNLLNGINFPDNSFSVIYHSQFIEHLPKEKAIDFMKECYRVLKPGGIMRVVTPDLENIARNYLRWLEQCITEPSEINEANYDWLMLEFFDQTIRNSYGG